MQARFYLPTWGRFASPDPPRDLHFEDTQSWNIYSYCGNNPVMRIDTDGMEWGWFDRALDTVANGAAAVYVGIQKIPVLGAAYASGARLGEAISGQRVEYGAYASGPSVQNLSLEERSQSALDGTKTVGALVAAGAVPGVTNLSTGTTVTAEGTAVVAQVTVSNGSATGAAAMPMASRGSGSGSSGGQSKPDTQRNGTPRTNTAQNKQFKDATKGLTKDEQ